MMKLENSCGVSVTLLEMGGAIQSIVVPDRDGRPADIVLGYDDPADYPGNSSFGAFIGRYANRIGGAQFPLNGRTYAITRNEGMNTLHSGRGYHLRPWNLERTAQGAALTILDPAGSEGFPGTLKLRVDVTLTEDSTLIFEYTAETDADTVVNFTNHTYFNLSGEETILGHHLYLNADSYLEVDEHLIPTGQRIDVSGTEFDFRRSRPIRDGKYDHCFLLNPGKPQAVVWDPVSGRGIRMETDQPGMQLYCGAWLGGVKGKNGRFYAPFAGLCLETQHFPDSPNHPAFPDTCLRAGEQMKTRTSYQFFAE